MLVLDSLLNGVLRAGIARRGLLDRRMLNRGSSDLLWITLHLTGRVSNGRLRDRLGLHLHRRLLRITICRLCVTGVSQIRLAVPESFAHIHRRTAQSLAVADLLDRFQSTCNSPASFLIKGVKIDADPGIAAGVDLALVVDIVAGDIHDPGFSGGGGVEEPVSLVLLALFQIFRVAVAQRPLEIGGEIGSPQPFCLSRLYRMVIAVTNLSMVAWSSLGIRMQELYFSPFIIFGCPRRRSSEDRGVQRKP